MSVPLKSRTPYDLERGDPAGVTPGRHVQPCVGLGSVLRPKTLRSFSRGHNAIPELS